LVNIYQMFHGLIDVRVNEFFQVQTANTVSPRYNALRCNVDSVITRSDHGPQQKKMHSFFSERNNDCYGAEVTARLNTSLIKHRNQIG
jgi:hypothetical protein